MNRNRQTVEDVLYSSQLTQYPCVDQATKIFVKWLNEHPEYSIEDVHIKIKEEKLEEDHYGHGGGYNRSLQIYVLREESELEYDNRISEAESIELKDFRFSLDYSLKELIRNFDIFDCVESPEITGFRKELGEDIVKLVSDRLHAKLKDNKLIK